MSCLSKQTEEYTWNSGAGLVDWFLLLFWVATHWLHSTFDSSIPQVIQAVKCHAPSVLSTHFLPFYSCLCQLLPHVTKCIIHDHLKCVYINYRSLINSEPCAKMLGNLLAVARMLKSTAHSTVLREIPWQCQQDNWIHWSRLKLIR